MKPEFQTDTIEEAIVTDVVVNFESNCPEGYSKPEVLRNPPGGVHGDMIALDGNLNQGVGGKEMYLCVKVSTTVYPGALAVTGLTLSGSRKRDPSVLNIGWRPLCPDGEGLAEVRSCGCCSKCKLSGNLNEDSGGKIMHLCLKKGPVSDGLKHVALYEKGHNACPDGWKLADKWATSGPDQVNGDLNQEARGYSIFLCTQ